MSTSFNKIYLYIIYLLILISSFIFGNDECPDGRQPLGKCIGSLCPYESECILFQCCAYETSNITTLSPNIPLSTIENEIDICNDGSEAIGACLGQYCPPGYICLENLCCIEKSDSYEVDNELNEWNTTSSFKVTELTTTPILNFSTEKTIIQTTQPVNTEPKNISTTEIYEETLTESYCPIGNSIGECISGECPYNYECIDDMCCKLSENINCKDLLPDCKKHLCQKEEYYDFLTLKCGRTCQRCHQQQFVKAKGKLSSKSNEKALERGKNTSSPKSKKRNLKCRDSRNDCEDWMREGFCYSPIYTLEQKKAICGVSCQLC